jgi:hypothetical protein
MTEPLTAAHPRTYSLVGSPHLFLVTDDESGITLGYADLVGGPLVAPALRPEPSGLREALVDDWWVEPGDAMVCSGLPGDEGFVADAASPDALSPTRTEPTNPTATSSELVATPEPAGLDEWDVGCRFDPYYCRAHDSERASVLEHQCRLASSGEPKP